MNVQTFIEARSRNHPSRGKAISIACCDCVSVAFGIQHAMRILHVVCHLWLAWLAVPPSSTLSKKRHDFRQKKKVTKHKTCDLIFSRTLKNF
jgi:hypothetical protein